MGTEKNLYSAFPYTNNITTAGQTQEKYYENVKISGGYWSEEIYNEQVEYCGISIHYHCVRLQYWEQWLNLILNDFVPWENFLHLKVLKKAFSMFSYYTK